jgi:pimeloyl-ACP methyl ester carboxylesterase
VAKDMEAVRASLGEGKLNYIGISYGTFIGGTYAELFPENIRAMVLDGITDHSCNEIRCQWEEYNDYELELVRFAKCKASRHIRITRKWDARCYECHC